MKIPKEMNQNLSARGLIFSIYILSFFLLFGNFFYSIFCSYKITFCWNWIRLHIFWWYSLHKTAFLYNCYFTCYFNLNVIYLSNILKALDSESLPCQNFIDDYIIIDNFSLINMTILKIIILELLKKLAFFNSIILLFLIQK